MTDFVELKSLAGKCRKGNRYSQKKFYMHYHAFGLRICLRYTSSRDCAIQILNESFYKFFTDTNLTNEDSSIENQLRRIIFNSIINDYHQSKNGGCDVQNESAIPEKGLKFNPMTENDTLSMLQMLPDLDRIIFNLYVVEGYSHQEIGQLLKIDVTESALRLEGARVRLRSLDQQGNWLSWGILSTFKRVTHLFSQEKGENDDVFPSGGDAGIRTLVQNRETLRLLHAYLWLNFRAWQGSKPTRVKTLDTGVSLNFRTTISTSADLRHPGAQPSARRLEGWWHLFNPPD